MLATWIKKSVGLTLAMTIALGSATPSMAGGCLGRAVLSRVASHSYSKGHSHSTPSYNYAPQYSQPVVPVCSQPVVQQPAPVVQTVAYPVPMPQPMPQSNMPAGSYGPMPGPMPGPGPGPMGPMGNPPVDLVIENIRFAEPSTMLVGPAYHIQVRNQGSEFAAKFHIALIANVGGVVNEQCPKAVLEVRDLAPGAAIEYTIRLPLAAEMIPDPMTQQPRPFTHLASVVDVFRIQPESDENNNTALLPRVAVDNAGR